MHNWMSVMRHPNTFVNTWHLIIHATEYVKTINAWQLIISYVPYVYVWMHAYIFMHLRTYACKYVYHDVLGNVFVYILTAALIEQSNDPDDQDIDTPIIAALIALGIGTLLLVIFMGSVVIYYWVPKYAKCLENNLGITNC